MFVRNGDIWLRDGAGKLVNVTHSPAASESYPAVPPDGRRVAYSANAPGGKVGIYVMDITGKNQKLVSAGPGRVNEDPTWSPDGKRIAYDSDAAGHPEVYVMNADGSGATRLTNTPAGIVNIEAAWSPDGTRIAFMSNRDRHTAVYTMSPDGSNELQVGITSVANAFPTWSPDSSQLAAAYSNDVYVFPSTGGPGVNLTTKGFHAISPAGSPDGSQIAFFSDHTRWDNGIVSVAVGNPSAWVDVTGDQAHGQKADNRYPGWVPGGPLAALEVTDAGCGSVRTGPLGARLQFNFRSSAPHTAVDATGLALYNAGAYDFQARLRNAASGAATQYSAPLTITVQP